MYYFEDIKLSIQLISSISEKPFYPPDRREGGYNPVNPPIYGVYFTLYQTKKNPRCAVLQSGPSLIAMRFWDCRSAILVPWLHMFANTTLVVSMLTATWAWVTIFRSPDRAWNARPMLTKERAMDRFYNGERPHQSLDYRPPTQALEEGRN